jgi:hypothetical protein
MVLAGIQKNNLDTDLRRYDVWDLHTHLCGVVVRSDASSNVGSKASILRKSCMPVDFSACG